MNDYQPLQSLKEGHWFKLICGASYQHLPAIRTLALAYALAGVDCIDVAADPAVISVVREALAVAQSLKGMPQAEPTVDPFQVRHGQSLQHQSLQNQSLQNQSPQNQAKPSLHPNGSAGESVGVGVKLDSPGPGGALAPSALAVLPEFPPQAESARSLQAPRHWSARPGAEPQPSSALDPGNPEVTASPWIMVSLNDGEDPHFRKASFDGDQCPPDCPRPCESLCPTGAIQVAAPIAGVQSSQCYGCGRCLAICPYDRITAHSFHQPVAEILPDILLGVDALELHTQVGHGAAFAQLWHLLRPHLHHLKVLAISCPYAPGVVDYLWHLYNCWLQPLEMPLIWQADGRPMSGDIGAGMTHLTLRYGQQLLAQGPPGYVQLAGGTNGHTVGQLRHRRWPTADASTQRTLPRSPDPHGDSPPEWGDRPVFGGIAYGGYGRQHLAPVIAALEAAAPGTTPRGGAAQAPSPLEAHPPLLAQAIAQARTLVAPLKALPRTWYPS